MGFFFYHFSKVQGRRSKLPLSLALFHGVFPYRFHLIRPRNVRGHRLGQLLAVQKSIRRIL